MQTGEENIKDFSWVKFQAKAQRYMDNLTEQGKEQIILFLLTPTKSKDVMENHAFIRKKAEEWSKLYPDWSK